MTVAALLLAAGASRRLGRPKQLLRLGGETLLERVLRLAREAGAAPTVAVLGAHEAEIRASVAFGDCVSVVNRDWEQGIATSIHAGLHALDKAAPDAPGALLMNCDQLRLTAAHLRALMETFTAQAGRAMVASAYAGAQGTPAVFPRDVFPELLALSGDRGARALFAKPPCPLLSVELPLGEVDIDLPDDLAQLEPD
jgi:CTP:molybdopterin cytidylyltransferase MocA